MISLGQLFSGIRVFPFIEKPVFSTLLRNILDTNRASRYKAQTKIKRRHGNECTPIHSLPANLVLRLNSFLIGTPSIRGRSEIGYRGNPDGQAFVSELSSRTKARHIRGDCKEGAPSLPVIFLFRGVGGIFLFIGKLFFSALLRNILDTNRASRYKARTKIKRRRTLCTLSIYFCAATP